MRPCCIALAEVRRGYSFRASLAGVRAPGGQMKKQNTLSATSGRSAVGADLNEQSMVQAVFSSFRDEKQSGNPSVILTCFPLIDLNACWFSQIAGEMTASAGSRGPPPPSIKMGR